ncbi:MAG: hypothetical protein N2504_05170 [candidate division WOR-3 bacterium]|nr:hypothetical protein [candidate division WOR-3 bacterium]MCX7947961.1 hypothetical protein [candidate division WOR-3 bacterium]MDW8150905.1 hypothetical protein [candidate division WOR-3 bacterium]
MLLLINFIYQVDIYDLKDREKLIVEYDFAESCELEITFRKNYDIYRIYLNIENPKGELSVELKDAKLIPTRSKPRSVPLTISGNCIGKIHSVKLE